MNLLSKNNILRRVLLILLLICLTTVGCSRANDNHPMYWNNVSAGMAPPLWLACSTEKSQLEFGEDLEVTLYYKPVTEYDASSAYSPTNITCKLKMRAHDQNSDIVPERNILIKEYDSFTPDMYQSYYRGDILFTTALESICVPSYWFSDIQGSIVFIADMDVTFPHKNSPTRWANGIAPYYKRCNNIIQLFGTYYDFANYKGGCS